MADQPSRDEKIAKQKRLRDALRSSLSRRQPTELDLSGARKQFREASAPEDVSEFGASGKAARGGGSIRPPAVGGGDASPYTDEPLDMDAASSLRGSGFRTLANYADERQRFTGINPDNPNAQRTGLAESPTPNQTEPDTGDKTHLPDGTKEEEKKEKNVKKPTLKDNLKNSYNAIRSRGKNQQTPDDTNKEGRQKYDDAVAKKAAAAKQLMKAGGEAKKAAKQLSQAVATGNVAQGVRGGVNALRSIRDIKKSGINLKAAGKQVVKAAESFGYNKAFYWLLSLIIPSIGLAIFGLDLLWIISSLRGAPLRVWQKIVILVLTLLYLMLIALIVFIIIYALCQDWKTQYASKGASWYYGIIDICQTVNNMSFSFSGGATEEIKLGGKLSIKQWVPKINQAANSAGLPDACMLAVVVQKESGGDPNAIGHDAHARSSDPFNPNSPPMYGLNWNYSHGIGLTQITIFPPHRYGGWRDPNTPSRRLVGKWLTVPDLINPDTSLQISAEYLTSLYKQHGNSIRTAFRAYNGSGPMAEAYADSAMALYNTCKAQNLTQ